MRPLHLVSCLLVLGCGESLPEQPTAGAAAGANVSVEPAAELDAIPAVCRLHLRGAARLAPEDVLLVEGELSNFYLRRIRDRDLPATLLQRVVPHLSWADGGGVTLAPSVALGAGARYSLATPDDGLVALLTVEQTPAPRLSRWFPPADTAGGERHAVYCAAEPVDIGEEAAPLAFEPGSLPIVVQPGIDARGTFSDRCVTLRALGVVEPGRALAPPLHVSGQVLEPSTLVSAAPGVPPSLACSDTQSQFGPACITMEDDRAVVQSIDDGTLWSIVRHDQAFVRAVAPGARFVLDGLSPASNELLDLELFDLQGDTWAGTFTLSTAPAKSHVVLNEVLANPLGPEPQQEWIELENDGSGPVDLAGFVLSDAGGSVELPSAWLGPGAFALLVREDYVADGVTDVAPAPGATLVRLAALGKNGLSNAGEALELRRPDGTVASRFPASPKPKSGVSVARRTPASLDDDPGAFGPSAEPGASPGAANALAEP